jgi:chromosome segregation ATPase
MKNNLTIDGQEVSVDQDKTLLDAARDRERKLNESIAGLRQQLESAQGRERELTRSLARGQERLSATQRELTDARHRLGELEQELTTVRQRSAERQREISGEFDGMVARERYERALAMLTLLESIDEVVGRPRGDQQAGFIPSTSDRGPTPRR